MSDFLIGDKFLEEGSNDFLCKSNNGGTGEEISTLLEDLHNIKNLNLKHAKILPLFLALFIANYQSGYSVKELIRKHRLQGISDTEDFKNRLYTLGLLYEYYNGGEEEKNKTYLYTGDTWASNEEYLSYFYVFSGYNEKWWKKEITKIMEGYTLYANSEQEGAKKNMQSLPVWWENSSIKIGWEESLKSEKERRMGLSSSED